MAAKSLPSQNYLRECFDYDPVSGVLTWRSRPREHFDTGYLFNNWNGRFAGLKAGTIHDNGYWFVYLGGRYYRAHRLIWRLMTGEEAVELDHRNRDRSDNRWENLRLATKTQNHANKLVAKTNVTGLKGVKYSKSRNCYHARIKVNQKEIFLGTFPTAEQAKLAYERAAAYYFGEYRHY